MGPRGGCERDLLGPVMIRKGGSREARIATWMWTQFRTAMGGMGGTVVRVSRHNETSPIETFPSDACLRLSAIRYVGFSFPLFFAFFFLLLPLILVGPLFNSRLQKYSKTPHQSTPT